MSDKVHVQFKYVRVYVCDPQCISAACGVTGRPASHHVHRCKLTAAFRFLHSSFSDGCVPLLPVLLKPSLSKSTRRKPQAKYALQASHLVRDSASMLEPFLIQQLCCCGSPRRLHDQHLLDAVLGII